MPGIAGIICPHPGKGIGQDLDQMLEAMGHEHFYRGSQYINKDLGLYMGWTCHKDSYADCMPLVDHDKGLVLIFQGENYLDSDSMSPLRNSNRSIDEFSARDLLNLYEDGEDDFLNRLNGWFCGVLVDLRSRNITLFNDRYGMSRVYFSDGNGEFVFASEAKSLLKVRPALRAIEPEALAQYFRCNCVTGNRTLFKDIALLPNASSWVFKDGALAKKQKYFDFSKWEKQPTLGADEFYQKFSEVTSKVFPSYARSPKSVGMSLTAGLDTRVIMASMRGHCQSLPCYTFGGTWGETFDIRTARTVAHLVGQPHEVIRINEDFFKEFANFAQRSVYLSDGTHDALGAHDVYFNQVAREIAPVRLTGKFGSEVVRVRKLIPWMDVQRDFLRPDFRPYLDRVPSVEQLSTIEHPLSRVVSEEIPWYESGRVTIEQSQVVLRTPYMDNRLVKVMFEAPFALRVSGGLQAEYVRKESSTLNAILTNLSRSGEGNWLEKEFFYLLFWSMFKAEYIYLFSLPHWLTWIDRRLEKFRLERILAGRQKFEAYRIWIRTHLAHSIRDILLNSEARLTQFFEKRAVEKVVQRHIAGTHNYLNEINRMLTVELICSSLLKP